MTTYNSSALESGKIDHGRACGNEIICSMTPTLTKVRSQKEGGGNDEPAVQLCNFEKSIHCFLVSSLAEKDPGQLNYKLTRVSTCKAGDEKVITHYHIRLHEMMWPLWPHCFLKNVDRALCIV